MKNTTKRKNSLTTMKQESIKGGFTKPMSSNRSKAWSGGAVSENQKKPFYSGKATSDGKTNTAEGATNRALAPTARKLSRTLGGSGSAIDEKTQKMKSALKKRGGK